MTEQINEGRNRIIIDDFSGGWNSLIDPMKMPENCFQTFENLILNNKSYFKSASKRYGFDRYYTAIPNGTGGVLALTQYITQNKSPNVDLIIIKTGTSLEYYNTGTSAWVNIDGSDAANAKVKFLTFQDNLYIFGRNTSGTMITNKVYNSTDLLDMGLIPCKQTFTCTDATGMSSTLATGTYKYLITFVYDDGSESYFIPFAQTSGSAYNTEVQSNYVNITTVYLARYTRVWTNASNKPIRITSIPTGNSRVKYRKIYRTAASGNILYYHSTIYDNTTTTIVDTKPDTELSEVIDLDIVYKPDIAKYGCEHKNRLWIANLKENIYADAPSVAGASATHGTDSAGDQLAVDPDSELGFYYSYKFANMFLHPTMGVADAEYTGGGFYGALSSGFAVEGDVGDENVGLSGLDPETSYSGHLAVFRTACQFVTAASVPGAGTVRLTLENTAEPFVVGETVKVKGLWNTDGTKTNHWIADGDYVITLVNQTSKYIEFSATATGTYDDAEGGRVAGTRYFFLGMTTIDGTTFTDKVSESDICKGENYLIQKGLEYISADKTLPSTVKFSEIDSEKFLATSEFNVFQNDNDVITGIFSDNNGVVVFKERNIYKIYTETDDSTFWQVRKVVNGVGCSDPYSIVQIKDLGFVFCFNNVFYVWNGQGEPVSISDPIQSSLDALTFTDITGVYYHKDNWVLWAYSTSGITGQVLVYDLNLKVWYHFVKNTIEASKPNLALLYPYVTKAGVLLLGSSFNRLYYYRRGTYVDDLNTTESTFADINIAIKLKTKDWDTYAFNIKRYLAKIHSGAAGTAATYVSFTGYKDENGLTPLNNSAVLASGFNRCNVPTTVQNAKKYNFEVAYADAQLIVLHNIGIDIQEIHQDKGF